ncbi:hypothetical protein STENM327S_08385 [Streptomyces tendae]
MYDSGGGPRCPSVPYLGALPRPTARAAAPAAEQDLGPANCPHANDLVNELLAPAAGGSARFTCRLEQPARRAPSPRTAARLGELRRPPTPSACSRDQDLGTELGGLVKDNEKQLGPTLKALGRVTSVLEKNNTQLGETLALVGPYYRLVGNTLGNGRWFDSYLCGVVPRDYLPATSQPDTGCQPPKQPAAAQGSGE